MLRGFLKILTEIKDIRVSKWQRVNETRLKLEGWELKRNEGGRMVVEIDGRGGNESATQSRREREMRNLDP